MTAPVETQLRCPASKCALRPMTLTDAEALLGATLRPANRTGSNSSPVGRTEHVMLRDDLGGAYPVLSDGIAVLMAPEILVPEGSALEFDLAYPIYSEAYAEMGHYDGRATEAMSQMAVSRLPAEFEDIVGMPAEARRASFSSGDLAWIDSPYDCLSQMDCYGAIGDVGGHTVAQLGGSGSHAVKFLLAGAARAYLFAPMVEELRFARALAEACGVSDRLVTLAAWPRDCPSPRKCSTLSTRVGVCITWKHGSRRRRSPGRSDPGGCSHRRSLGGPCCTARVFGCSVSGNAGRSAVLSPRSA